MAILRVELLYLVDIHTEHLSHLLEVYVAVYDHGVGLYGQVCTHRTDIVLTIVVHYIVGGDERWYVATCFLRQIRIDAPVVFLAV